MANNFRWNGGALKRRLEAEMGKRLDAAAVAVEGHAKTLISVEGTGKKTVTTTDKKGRKRKRTVLDYGANPSKPGEPPHTQTGQLRASVGHERSGLVARVGSFLKKARYLELGTTKMRPRPWLRRALIEMTPAIRATVGKPID